jgi:hypothetical protein
VNDQPLHACQAREAIALLAIFGAPPADDRTVSADNRRLTVLARLQTALLGRPVPILVMPKTAQDDVDADLLPAGAPPRCSMLRPAPVVDLAEVELPVLGVFHADENPGGAL